MNKSLSKLKFSSDPGNTYVVTDTVATSAVNEHVADSSVHVTAVEKAQWTNGINNIPEYVEEHDESNSAHTALFNQKMDKVSGGTAGQILTRTSSGCEWRNPSTTGSGVIVSDNLAVFQSITKLTFPNATITVGENGEVIVNFNDADGDSMSQMNNLQELRSDLATNRSGGGSAGGNVGTIAPEEGFMSFEIQPSTSFSEWSI